MDRRGFIGRCAGGLVAAVGLGRGRAVEADPVVQAPAPALSPFRQFGFFPPVRMSELPLGLNPGPGVSGTFRCTRVDQEARSACFETALPEDDLGYRLLSASPEPWRLRVPPKGME